MKLNKITAVSLAINLAVVAAGALFIARKGGVSWIMQKAHERTSPASTPTNTRKAMFDLLPITPRDTIFLGDSILAAGEWAEMRGDAHCKNRAIPGDTTANVLARLDSIISGKPARVVLLVGINDFQTGANIEQTKKQYAEIVLRLRFAGCAVTIIPLLPVNVSLYREWIEVGREGIHRPGASEVGEFNTWLADRGEALIDTASLLKDGELNSACTNDGLHLNGAGLIELNKLIP